MALAFAIALVCAATAHAADFRAVLCAANNGSNSYGTTTNTTSPQNPGGIFNFENYCGPAPFPAGDQALLRIQENQPNGNAGQGAYGDIYYDTPPYVHFREAGGFTRQPGTFNEGWRERFWVAGGSVGGYELLSQGLGAPTGITSTFSSHLWPVGGYLDFTRFVFELTCVRPAGCDRSGGNAADANSFVFTLADESPSQVGLTNNGGPIMEGRWVKGAQTATYQFTELGSGIRMERVRIDGADRLVYDHWNECDQDSNGAIGVFARSFQPCAVAPNPIGRSYTFDTASLADGAHSLQACTQDFAQWQGVNGNGGESCDQRQILTDNTAPGAPAGLEVTSANPARYLQHVGARWQLPPNQGSPIAAVHYEVINAAGTVVVPTRTVSATDPSSLSGIEGPKAPGDYRLRLWLEDSVGFNGPPALAQIPHDTTPPAAPQELTAVGPASWGPAQGYRLHWQNVVDNGSPIVAARYQVLGESGQVVEATKVATGEGAQDVASLDVPREAHNYSARVWLEDEEGNVGSAATAPIPRDTTPPAAPQDLSVTAPDTSRSAQGFDVRWRNVADNGSPILAAHYQVLDDAGKVIVADQTQSGAGVQSIADLETPSAAGSYRLRLWLVDAEGNAGAPSTAPLSYECVRSPTPDGQQLSAALGGQPTQTVQQGQGTVLSGTLAGQGGGVAAAPVCVYSRAITDSGLDLLGIALTDQAGNYRFPVPAGPSRELTALHRSGQRQLRASATLQTVVHPTLRARKTVVHNGEYGYFEGEIPGPHNDNVTIVEQVRSGKGWLTFRRYRTRNDGHYEFSYLFRRTSRLTTYEMRAEVREAGGYPYLEGDSDPVAVRVLPDPPKAAAKKKSAPDHRCAKKVRSQRRRGADRCAKKHRHASGTAVQVKG